MVVDSQLAGSQFQLVAERLEILEVIIPQSPRIDQYFLRGRFDIFELRQALEGKVEFLGGQKARIGWRLAAQHITAISVHKQDAFADEVINTELDKVLDRGKDIPTALADAQRLLQQRAKR